MTYKELLEQARNNLDGRCKACAHCNGKACAGVMPGPGGKMTGAAFIRNYDKLHEVKMNMDTIYEMGEVDTGAELFGKRFAAPFFAAPIAGIEMHYGDHYTDTTYAEPLVFGCKDAGIAAFTGDGAPKSFYYPYIDAIKAAEGWGVATIKPWEYEDVMEKLRAAEEAGAMAICMDVDAAGLPHLMSLTKRPVGAKTTAQLKEIIDSTKLPFIIKGIMTVKGALKALEAGAYGIVVSNHGGRVLDDCRATVEVLPEIVRAVGGKMKIFIDGGIRTGLDLFKVLAMGADAVLIGRPFPVAVYGGGREGVALYANKVITELSETMRMVGAKTIGEIVPEMVYID